jgi:hypothetical protein
VTDDKLMSFSNQTPTEVQCAGCHWQGLSSDLVLRGDDLGCPVCGTPFTCYPQRAEHLWSDPY